MNRPTASLLVLLTFFTLSISYGQATNTSNKNNQLEWNEFYRLGWHDFQGEPTEESIGDAGTSVLIKAKPFYVKKKVVYDVYAYFNKRKSWSRDQSPELLAHEQLHFDIAEPYARKIRKKIAELSDRGVNDVQVYNAAIRQLLEESNEADLRYDGETLHGSMVRKQAAWEKKIKEELLSLQKYKKEKRVIAG